MKIFKDKHSLQKEISKIKGISFVPTMGGLHKGHISLIKKSKKFKLKSLISIFVLVTIIILPMFLESLTKFL